MHWGEPSVYICTRQDQSVLIRRGLVQRFHISPDKRANADLNISDVIAKLLVSSHSFKSNTPPTPLASCSVSWYICHVNSRILFLGPLEGLCYNSRKCMEEYVRRCVTGGAAVSCSCSASSVAVFPGLLAPDRLAFKHTNTHVLQ